MTPTQPDSVSENRLKAGHNEIKVLLINDTILQTILNVFLGFIIWAVIETIHEPGSMGDAPGAGYFIGAVGLYLMSLAAQYLSQIINIAFRLSNKYNNAFAITRYIFSLFTISICICVFLIFLQFRNLDNNSTWIVPSLAVFLIFIFPSSYIFYYLLTVIETITITRKK